MENNSNNLKTFVSVIRHYGSVMTFAVLVVIGISLITWHYNKDQINYKAPEELTNAGDIYSLPRAFPTELRIPEIKVDTTFEAPLELNKDKTIEVPDSYDKVGWYKLGAAPGEVGTATILGHVDSVDGAEVFYLLGQLEPGDEVFVDRDDGTTATFVVEKLERFDQDEFPAEEVYGMTDYPSLRLITCTGSYDHQELRYSHNLVVFAKLVEPEPAESNQVAN